MDRNRNENTFSDFPVFFCFATLCFGTVFWTAIGGGDTFYAFSSLCCLCYFVFLVFGCCFFVLTKNGGGDTFYVFSSLCFASLLCISPLSPGRHHLNVKGGNIA